jgi:head-tail adaptor
MPRVEYLEQALACIWIAYHWGREIDAAGRIRVSKEGKGMNLSELFAKTVAVPKRYDLLEKYIY